LIEAASAYSNESGAVLVDRTAPSLTLTCPATAELDARGVNASYSASDGQSGLASSPSGNNIAIPTASLGEQTVSETATDNAGTRPRVAAAPQD
jgi:hypothetical protein